MCAVLTRSVGEKASASSSTAAICQGRIAQAKGPMLAATDTERDRGDSSGGSVEVDGELDVGAGGEVGILRVTRMTKGSVCIEHRTSEVDGGSDRRFCDCVGDGTGSGS